MQVLNTHIRRKTLFFWRFSMYSAVGKKKTSIARVSISLGSGIIKINSCFLDDYYSNSMYAMLLRRPLGLVGLCSEFNICISVCGGGTMSQVHASQHALSKCLLLCAQNGGLELNPVLVKSTFKANNLLTRDARIVERKKVGFRKARKKEQYSKR